MFGSLKEKLKSWIGKAKETAAEEPLEEIVIEDAVERKAEKSAKKTEKKSKKEKVVEVEDVAVEVVEPTLEAPLAEEVLETSAETVAEEPTEKKGFFSKLFGKKETEELVVEEAAEEVLDLEEVDEAEEVLEVEEVEEIEEEQKPSFFNRFKAKLTEDSFEELFEGLEMILLQNNVAVGAVESIRKNLKEKLVGKNLSDVDLGKELQWAIKLLLLDGPDFLGMVKEKLKEKTPVVIVFAGINGSGKTTSIAKVAHLLLQHKFSVCLAAADTFRAASIEQIQQHADRLGVHLIKKDYGADPSSVGFDAIAYAKKHKIDVVLIDTAGRMQNKDSLMKEMEKIVRVTKPDMKIFLGESTTGNDAVEQAKAFNDAIDLTGIILSKADVDEKGGTAISVSHATGKPILFLGTGQEYKDLEVFDKGKMVERLGLGGTR